MSERLCVYRVPDYTRDILAMKPNNRLQHAIDHGDVRTALKAIAAGADINTVTPPHNTTVLIICARMRSVNTETIDYLIANGANIDQCNAYGTTALITAAIRNNRGAVQTLLRHHANINHQNEDGYTALIYAVDNFDTAALDELVAHGADINVCDNNGLTALLWAIWYDRRAAVDKLLARGANVNARTNRGFNVYDMVRRTPEGDAIRRALDWFIRIRPAMVVHMLANRAQQPIDPDDNLGDLEVLSADVLRHIAEFVRRP